MQYEINKIYNMDCLEAMKDIPDKYFELAIVDPPYGINVNMNAGRKKNTVSKKRANKKWDSISPNKTYFEELFRISNNQIIWGANYFEHLPIISSWIFWDKMVAEKCSFSDGDLAWTSLGGALVKVVIPWSGFIGSDGQRIHPTQKPVALYKWLLKNYAKKGDKILDTHLGSASSIIACIDMGFDFMGLELDEDYFNKARKRIQNHTRQEDLTRDSKFNQIALTI